MLSREEEIINLYLDGFIIEKICKQFSITIDEVKKTIIGYRAKRIINLTANLDYNEDNLNVISHFIDESIEKINKKSTNEERRRICNIIKLAEDGVTLISIGNIFSISRERVRQILNTYSPEISLAKETTRYNNCEICGRNLKGVHKRGKYNLICEPCYKKIIKKNKKRWSKKFDKCIDCGTTELPHHIGGRCRKCHSIFSYHYDLSRRKSIKKSSEKWRLRNLERVKETNRKTAERMKERALDGNRKMALERDQYKCQKCGMSREESLRKNKRDLYVSHLKDPDDHSLDNLITLCSKCHYRMHRFKIL